MKYLFTLKLSLQMAQLICVKDYENQALQVLSPSIRSYYISAAGEEDTFKANTEAFKK